MKFKSKGKINQNQNFFILILVKARKKLNSLMQVFPKFSSHRPSKFGKPKIDDEHEFFFSVRSNNLIMIFKTSK